MLRLGATVVLLTALAGLCACSAPAETAAPTRTPEATAAAPQGGDAILIETRITDARTHIGEVLEGSVIGETAFCVGGTSTGSSEGPTITSVITCPEGTLTLQYAPTQHSLAQSSEWEVVSGTGSFEGLTGGGTMVASFQSDDPDAGREVFTGTVSR
jgi:hypothetical protein